MSAFASYASTVNSPNTVLPPVQTTGTEGSTYKYASSAGGIKYAYKTHKKRSGGKSHKNRRKGTRTYKKKNKSHKK